MTFSSEEARTRFHELPAQKQLEWCELELYLCRSGKQIHILEVTQHEDCSEVIINILDKFDSSVRQ